MIDVGSIEASFAHIIRELASLAAELRCARVLTENSTDTCEIEEAIVACDMRIHRWRKRRLEKLRGGRVMKPGRRR